MNPIAYTRAANLPHLMQQRILVLDGAMGTMIQRYKLSEADFRGSRFADPAPDATNPVAPAATDDPATASPIPATPHTLSATREALSCGM